VSDEQIQKVGTTDAGNTGDDAANAALAGDLTDADHGPETDGADEGKRHDWKTKYLTETKTALEEKNRLAERVRELEEQAAGPKSPTPDPQAQDEERFLQELMQDLSESDRRYQETKDIAYKNSSTSLRMQIAREKRDIEERIARDAKEADHDYLAAAEVPDDETGEDRPMTVKEKQALLAFHKRNPGVFRNLEAAHDAMIGRNAKQALREAAQVRARAKRETERRDDGVVNTSRRDVSARVAQERKMTEAQIDARQAQLDATDPKAAWKFKQDVAHGRIVSTG
jgi:hypothetical protein